ncbi:Dbl homology domain-containing protein, partial [Jimgerdemannia flammicorona]
MSLHHLSLSLALTGFILLLVYSHPHFVSLQELEQRLTDQGYVHSWKLARADERRQATGRECGRGRHLPGMVGGREVVTSCGVCKQQLLYQQFINIIGSTSLLPDAHLHKNRIAEPTIAREFTQGRRLGRGGGSISTCCIGQSDPSEKVMDDERRTHLVREFVATEDSYVHNLQVFARPLRSFARDKSQAILDNYQAKKIFVNVEELLAANHAFIVELNKSTAVVEGGERPNFGDVCAKHVGLFVASKVCYSKFLLGAEESQAVNVKEQKTNGAYRNYLAEHPDARRQTIQDLLVQPGQRIARYTLLLEPIGMVRGAHVLILAVVEILRLTPDDHPDFRGLAVSLTKAQEIATMADDYHTKSANILFNMHRSIQHCPVGFGLKNCDVLVEIRHVDATELDLLTHKPLRPVTFFLFTDLLMVAARPSYQANGLECCGLNGDVEVAPALSAFDSLFAKRNPALQRRVEKPAKMKFKGWIGIEEVELFEGCAGQPSTFLVRASSSTPDPPSPTAPTRGILGTYFQEQPVRLYALASPTDETMASPTVSPAAVQLNAQGYMEQKDEFLAQIHRTKALAKRS